MNNYILTLLGTALVFAIVGILVPTGERGGIAKHVRLVAALIWICVLTAPVCSAIAEVRDWMASGEWLPLPNDTEQQAPQEIFDGVLNEASTAYFCDMLTQTLEQTFEIAPGEVTCRVEWSQNEGQLTPAHVTVVLSGRAIWKSPHEIESFVRTLLECDCSVAID